MNKSLLAASAALLALVPAQQVLAQDAAPFDDVVTELEPVYVTTPLRRPSTITQSTSTVTVIDEEDIAKSAAPDLPSLLRKYPGVNITTNGGQGAQASVTLRSARANQTLVLVDGMRVASATTGTAYLSNIPLSAVNRIEVVEGAHSAQWGADAIGGVINIITRDGSFCENGKNVCTTVETGVTWPWGGFANGTVRGSTADGVDFNVGLGILGTEGYNFTTPASGLIEPDDDGFLQGSFNYALSKDFLWGRLYTDGFYARSNPHFDGASSWGPGANQSLQTNAGFKVGAEIDHGEDWSSVFEIYSALDYNKTFLKGDATYNSDFDTTRYGLNASTTKEFVTGDLFSSLTFGGEAYEEHVSSSTDYSKSSRAIGAVYTQYSLEWEALDLNAGLRYDANEDFGGALTYNVGVGYELIEGLTARASFATGFRAPDFNQLYYPGYFGSYVGNPDLDPERSKSYEVGLNWAASDTSSVDLVWYQTFIDDMIDYTSDFSTYTNIDKAKISGVRAVWSQALMDDRLGLDFGFEYRLPKDETDDQYIANQNRLKLTAAASWQATEALNLNADIEYVGSRWTNTASYNPQLGDYTLVNVSALYDIDQAARVKFAVENLFDEDYETAYGYNAPGTTVTLSYQRTF
ncbi:TonB-dependent receptor domain-containing protein [uncultured Martelella sp.]|uniref:TonB-dependent receptor domain-containing protein n=1 Tax=uncultured Martelella sp. TaxID=392331 RepID=UPI0029C63FD8|nr:TonB-dependent receptor [uncultured Martelella sp.]